MSKYNTVSGNRNHSGYFPVSAGTRNYIHHLARAIWQRWKLKILCFIFEFPARCVRHVHRSCACSQFCACSLCTLLSHKYSFFWYGGCVAPLDLDVVGPCASEAIEESSRESIACWLLSLKKDDSHFELRDRERTIVATLL